MKQRVLIIGCGYVGLELAQTLKGEGADVLGIVKTGEGLNRLKEAGVSGRISDCTTSQGVNQACEGVWDVVVFSLSSKGGDYSSTYLNGMRGVTHAFRNNPPQCILYTGSTSVYEQADGEWIREDSRCDPNHEKGRILFDAERVLENYCQTHPVRGVVFRVSGIYGPGRHHWIDTLKKGVAKLPGDGQRWMNQIHRDDVVHALKWGMQLSAQTGFSLFNLTDNEPVLQHEMIRWMCQRMKIKEPVFDRNMPNRGRDGRSSVANRRISNQRIREAGWRPCFPTFREGMKQLMV